MWHVWRRGEMHTGFWRRNLRERDHLEDIGVDVRIILKWIFKNGIRVDCTGLLQDRENWPALVIILMKLRVP
jgi:hypothetical protein